MAIVSGTFSGTGASDPITGRTISIKMDFAGTASVDVEFQMKNGGWVKHPDGTAITADCHKIYETGGIPVAVRLNCTAHTNNVVYDLETGEAG